MDFYENLMPLIPSLLVLLLECLEHDLVCLLVESLFDFLTLLTLVISFYVFVTDDKTKLI